MFARQRGARVFLRRDFLNMLDVLLRWVGVALRHGGASRKKERVTPRIHNLGSASFYTLLSDFLGHRTVELYGSQAIEDGWSVDLDPYRIL